MECLLFKIIADKNCASEELPTGKRLTGGLK